MLIIVHVVNMLYRNLCTFEQNIKVWVADVGKQSRLTSETKSWQSPRVACHS